MAFRKVAVNAIAMSSVTVFRLAAQFLVVPVLSRLLSPHDYGLVALAMPFVLFTMMFTDAGIGQSLVRTTRTEEDVWSTSFWITVMLGIGLMTVIVCIGPLAAMFFDEPALGPLVMALALVVPPQAASTIPEAALRQEHRFGTIAATEAAAIAVSILTAVFFAWMGAGAWSLIAQQLMLYGTRFVLTYWYSPFRPRLQFRLPRVREHLVFGRDVLGANFVMVVTQTVDSFIVGKLLGPALLGLYTMAFLFARLPWRIVAGPLEYVIYAHLAKIRDNRQMTQRLFLLLTRVTAIIITPGMGLVAAAHEPTFRLLLSEKWQASGVLFMIAAPAAALQAIASFSAAFLMAAGRTDLQLRRNLEYLAVLLVSLAIFAPHGIGWAAFGYAVSVFVYFPRYMQLALDVLSCKFSAYLGALLVPVPVTAACFMSYQAISRRAGAGDWGSLLIGGFLAVAGMAVSALLQARALRRDIKYVGGMQEEPLAAVTPPAVGEAALPPAAG
ncbi:MAG TPA: lipopolysaccharide biosynthesis protein [Patescibacteria group bacterium]|nr:lipopolysaccharide biosynthesis protein [Patescibacteria group bacterium]